MGVGPDGACMHVLMCGFTYMYVFSHMGVGSSVYEYMWGTEVSLNHRSSGTIYLVILRKGLIGLEFKH